MPVDSGLAPAGEHGCVLGARELARGDVEVVEVDVLGAAVAGAQLLERDRERRPQLHQWQNAAALRLDAPSLAPSTSRPGRGWWPSTPSRAGPQKSTSRRAASPGTSRSRASVSISFQPSSEIGAWPRSRWFIAQLPIPSEPSPVPAARPPGSSSSSPVAAASAVLAVLDDVALLEQHALRRSRARSASAAAGTRGPSRSACTPRRARRVITARASGSRSTASRCSYQPIASASSVSEAHSRAKVRVSAGNSSGGSWYWSNPICFPSRRSRSARQPNVIATAVQEPPAVAPATLEQISRRVLWLASAIVHHANRVRPERIRREGRRPPGLERLDGLDHDRAVVRVPRGARPGLGEAARLARTARDQLPARRPRPRLPDAPARVRRPAELPEPDQGPRPGRLLDRLRRDRGDGDDLGRAGASLRRRALRGPRRRPPDRARRRRGARRGRLLGGARRPDGRRGSARCCGSSTSTASRWTASSPTWPPGGCARCSRPPAGTA